MLMRTNIKKLLALLLLSPLVAGEDDVISLICKYEEGSQIRISNIYKWSTSYFADEKVTINILPSKKIATINEGSWEYFAEVKPSEITISTRVSTFNGNIQDVGQALGHYEYITINRESGILAVRNHSKQEKVEVADDYPLSISRKYNCRSLKIKF